MSTLLIVTASPRGDRSASRALTATFAELWARKHPADTVLLRDVGHHPVPHITEAWVVGAFAPTDAQTAESRAAIAVSDSLVEEFLSADRYVFGVPMYNFNVPSTFKAYLDQIVRAGKTFGFGPTGYEGLVKNKKALLITASGGAYAPGTPAAAMNFLEPYLRTIFGFIGLTDLHFITADSQAQGEDAARHATEIATNALKELAESW